MDLFARPRSQLASSTGVLPAELWLGLPADDMDGAQAQLNRVLREEVPIERSELGSELHQRMATHVEDVLWAEVERQKEIAARLRRPTRTRRRAEVCGYSNVQDWRSFTRELAEANPTPPSNEGVILRRVAAALRMTPHERKKMPLPIHLAYRTPGGIRNC
eukprot:Hpha_TRINITY_DN15958_c0_g1::TRINITY_DN15958_c0_g1_i2::g.73032::m.73032